MQPGAEPDRLAAMKRSGWACRHRRRRLCLVELAAASAKSEEVFGVRVGWRALRNEGRGYGRSLQYDSSVGNALRSVPERRNVVGLAGVPGSVWQPCCDSRNGTEAVPYSTICHLARSVRPSSEFHVADRGEHAEVDLPLFVQGLECIGKPKIQVEFVEFLFQPRLLSDIRVLSCSSSGFLKLCISRATSGRNALNRVVICFGSLKSTRSSRPLTCHATSNRIGLGFFFL